MDVSSVNGSASVNVQNLATEASEPKATETNETAAQENREPYRVQISQEALNAQATTTEAPPESANSPVQGSEAVQTYTSGGQIAG